MLPKFLGNLGPAVDVCRGGLFKLESCDVCAAERLSESLASTEELRREELGDFKRGDTGHFGAVSEIRLS